MLFLSQAVHTDSASPETGPPDLSFTCVDMPPLHTFSSNNNAHAADILPAHEFSPSPSVGSGPTSALFGGGVSPPSEHSPPHAPGLMTSVDNANDLAPVPGVRVANATPMHDTTLAADGTWVAPAEAGDGVCGTEPTRANSADSVVTARASQRGPPGGHGAPPRAADAASHAGASLPNTTCRAHTGGMGGHPISRAKTCQQSMSARLAQLKYAKQRRAPTAGVFIRGKFALHALLLFALAFGVQHNM